MAPPSTTLLKITRGRKVITRSRQGCSNCKLRKVKCDERRPKCKRCMAYGVLCDYDGKNTDLLQLSADGAFNVNIIELFPSPSSLHIPTTPAPVLRVQSSNGAEKIASYQLTERDSELVKKFQGRTLFTISNKNNVDAYLSGLVRLGSSCPYLMHGILTLTLMHDRWLSSVTTPLSTKEAFHWYQCVSQFNTKLSSGLVQPSDRDSLWATAMFLGIISFFYLDARSPEEAWPFATPSPIDLNWLTLSNGKNDVWRVAGPPTFKNLFDQPFSDMTPFLPETRVGLETLPFELITLCGLDLISANNDNPYYAVAHGLAQLINGNSMMPIIFGFLSFVGKMKPDFKQLLYSKDPCALMLLVYWYAKLYQFPHWWWQRRALLEGQSICMYLETYWGFETNIIALLEFPVNVFQGLSV